MSAIENDQPEDLSKLTLPDFNRIDISKLAPKQPDFIVTHPRGREFFSLLYFNTGHFWLGGFSAGGLYGVVEGYRKAINPTFKIRLNSIMNAVAMRGGKIGNTLGAIAFLHTIFLKLGDDLVVPQLPNSLSNILDKDTTSHVVAGIITGGFYKSTVGLRGTMAAALLGGVISPLYLHGSTIVYNFLHKKDARF